MSARTSAALVGALLLGGCGGKVVYSEDGTGGAGGAGGTTTSGPSTTSASQGTTDAASTGTGGHVCTSHDYVECLAAAPDCVPLFDDACCPACSPGPCADCVDYQFLGCVDASVGCDGVVECGQVGKFACEGQGPTCFMGGGNCSAEMGCVDGLVCDGPGPCEVVCRPTSGASCTAVCAVPPPPCPMGLVPEADGSCWTGLCIPAWVCGE